jgi:hypothetical protein
MILDLLLDFLEALRVWTKSNQELLYLATLTRILAASLATTNNSHLEDSLETLSLEIRVLRSQMAVSELRQTTLTMEAHLETTHPKVIAPTIVLFWARKASSDWAVPLELQLL